MYEAFYGLTEKPFNLTPDPRFLFLSEKHREAFAHLLFGIRNRSGFVMVTGEIGTGKTTICRTLLNQLDDDTEVAFIFNPCLSPDELLRKINEDFGIRSSADTIKDLIDELNEYLLARSREGKNCVLVIDEAQDLTPRVLEQIRLLSNLETESQKLLQIILIGQPELARSLSLDELRQLNQRITARYHLKPLDMDETVQYVAYRLRVAGGRRKVHFSRGALRALYRFSGGTPRVINAACDRALLIGYTREVKDINARIMKRAVKEVRGDRLAGKRKTDWGKLLPSRGVVYAAILIVLAGKFLVGPLASKWGEEGASKPPPAPVREMATVQTPPAPPVAVEPPGPPRVKNEPDSAPPEPTEPALAAVLKGVEPAIARNAGVVAVLRAWDQGLEGDYPESGDVNELARFAVANGLKVQSLSTGFDEVLAINLPVLLRVAGDTQPIWIGLLAAKGDNALIASRVGETAPVPIEDVRERYLGQAVLFWRDADYLGDRVLGPRMRGPSVVALQERLASLGRLSGPVTGMYDRATEAAVRAIQEETGLAVDGRTGDQTRMVLASWAPDFPSPTLARPEPDEDEDTTLEKEETDSPTLTAHEDEATTQDTSVSIEQTIAATPNPDDPPATEDRQATPEISLATAPPPEEEIISGPADSEVAAEQSSTAGTPKAEETSAPSEPVAGQASEPVEKEVEKEESSKAPEAVPSETAIPTEEMATSDTASASEPEGLVSLGTTPETDAPPTPETTPAEEGGTDEASEPDRLPPRATPAEKIVTGPVLGTSPLVPRTRQATDETERVEP